MSSVQEIEQAIVTLSPREQEELYMWMDERLASAVDAKIARDLDAGVFDDDIRSALADHEAGNTRAL